MPKMRQQLQRSDAQVNLATPLVLAMVQVRATVLDAAAVQASDC